MVWWPPAWLRVKDPAALGSLPRDAIPANQPEPQGAWGTGSELAALVPRSLPMS